jgi:hypothetical protein
MTAPTLHRGMPPLDTSGKPMSFFEFWPMWLFYAPLAPYLAWLAVRFRGALLPLLANPGFPAGGLVGESKSDILTSARSGLGDRIAPFITIERSDASIAAQAQAALAAAERAGLRLPLVAKPDIGCRGAGVRVMRSVADIYDYICAFPAKERFLLQRLIDQDAEAGVFYVRPPGRAQGEIISLTLKYFPHVIGDGVSTVRQLILADSRAGPLAHLYLDRQQGKLETVLADGEPLRLAFAGSHSRGAIFRDGSDLITPEMTRAFHDIAARIPGFHFGRFDVRFSDYHALQRGEGFTILEINGAGAESTHIWDRRTRLSDAYRALMRQYRLMFEIGAANRRQGVRPPRLVDFWRMYRREKQLVPLYPATQ